MHTFINSRPMAQMVALDLMAEEAWRAQARRERRREEAAASVDAGPAPARQPSRRWARSWHLVH